MQNRVPVLNLVKKKRYRETSKEGKSKKKNQEETHPGKGQQTYVQGQGVR